jgi:lipopolysaccharide/colanic/teichoic acid biosynthesis glycosyltransferase
LIHDPRVTRVGKFLRKSSLDELPQLWNIFRGEMSLVGPRPAIPYEVEEYQRWHLRRLEAMSGLTGLWQVTARSSANFDEIIRLDIEYIENQSFLLDIKILLKTPFVVLRGKGAT